ncbi:hypothetical protein AB0K15_47660 [Amycolatopsis sp. NPDC049253]|uniref:hypothetical protein n=1 Tax=Amycolatopsis sp. NPDC049253 TaxID=3155274 RepID=UPI00341EC986
MPSPAVLEGLARALNLDAAARVHLEDLVGPAGPGNRARPSVQRVRPAATGSWPRSAANRPSSWAGAPTCWPPT